VKALLLSLATFTLSAFSQVADPFAISSKVQMDLDNALSHLIPTDQFLVQVNAEIFTRTERRVVEGETLVVSSLPRQRPVEPMPGFVPETVEKEEVPTPPSRQSFRLVEVPELKVVRVSVSFDQALDRASLNRAQFLVRTYLETNYRGLASLNFLSVPMLKIPKEPVRDIASEKQKWEQERAEMEKAEREKLEKEKAAQRPSDADIVWGYARWGICAVLFLLLLLVVRQRREGTPQVSTSAPAKDDLFSKASLASILGQRPSFDMNPPSRKNSGEDEEPSVAELRKKILERFITRAQAFRQYFLTLSQETANELYACVSGPALDRLLKGLGIAKPPDERMPSDADEILEKHLKSFEEFTQAKEWQDRQFFGFLQNLSDEQLATIVASQTPVAACVLIRMLQPKQSAAVLDLLSASKRHDILSHIANIPEVPFSDIVAIEKEIRLAANQVPDRFLGSQKEDADFWGNVVSESSDQDPIFEEIERTRPDIAPQIKKFKFRLEEAASLPDSLLEKVLGAVDNEELCLALSTCATDVRDVLLDALSPSRRTVLKNLFPTYRGAPRERALPARAKLTRRIREALA
jgi:hypothetical protein